MSALLGWVRTNPRAGVGGGLVVLVCLLCGAAPLIPVPDPLKQDVSNGLQPPGATHLMGTDEFGRDVLARVLHGGRPTLGIAVATVALSLVIGLPTGVLAGYYAGRVDLLLMRVVEFGFVLPPLVLAIAVVAALGTGAANVVLALGIVFAPIQARVARAATLSRRREPFVEAAVVLGERDRSILLFQILPNIAAPVLVQTLLAFAYAVLAEASLSFLGLGTQPPLPSWGRMLTDAVGLVQLAPWTALFPGLFIVVTVFSLNLFGDGLRDIWDPHVGAAEIEAESAGAPAA
jgi:peptide/nickel transport system permease protein